MAYRFKLDQSCEKNTRRIVLSQIAVAEKCLAGNGERAVAIHESRKCFKRVRALLRLVRAGIGEAVYARENAAFRDIADLLASSRDRHVLLQTIASIEAEGDAEVAGRCATMRAALAFEPDGPSSDGEGERFEQARAGLAAARKRIGRIKLAGAGFSPIEEGLRRTYKKGAEEMAIALSGEDDEPYHEWRKAAQQHWRQMRLLAPAWPEYFELRANAARQISQLLGEDHDLSVFLAFARDRKRSGLGGHEADRVAAVVKARQRALRTKAAAHGRSLFAGKPKSFAGHIAGVWAAAERAAAAAKAKSDEGAAET